MAREILSLTITADDAGEGVDIQEEVNLQSITEAFAAVGVLKHLTEKIIKALPKDIISHQCD